MDIYEVVKVFLFAACVVIVMGMVLACIGIWLFSRETHIEPIVSSHKKINVRI